MKAIYSIEVLTGEREDYMSSIYAEKMTGINSRNIRRCLVNAKSHGKIFSTETDGLMWFYDDEKKNANKVEVIEATRSRYFNDDGTIRPMFIYGLTNGGLSDVFYVGRCSNIDRRVEEHKCEALNKWGHNKVKNYLVRLGVKLGTFKMVILEENGSELYWQNKYPEEQLTNRRKCRMR